MGHKEQDIDWGTMYVELQETLEKERGERALMRHTVFERIMQGLKEAIEYARSYRFRYTLLRDRFSKKRK